MNIPDEILPDPSLNNLSKYNDYWKLVVGYTGCPEGLKEDVVHEFYLKVVEKGYLSGYDPKNGSFKNLCILRLKKTFNNYWLKESRPWRGGGSEFNELNYCPHNDGNEFWGRIKDFERFILKNPTERGSTSAIRMLHDKIDDKVIRNRYMPQKYNRIRDQFLQAESESNIHPFK